MAKMMKMLSDPSGISKMMRAVQGLTKGMSGGGGPLFGGNQQQQQPAPVIDVGDVNANMSAPTSTNTPKFKTRF